MQGETLEIPSRREIPGLERQREGQRGGRRGWGWGAVSGGEWKGLCLWKEWEGAKGLEMLMQAFVLAGRELSGQHHEKQRPAALSEEGAWEHRPSSQPRARPGSRRTPCPWTPIVQDQSPCLRTEQHTGCVACGCQVTQPQLRTLTAHLTTDALGAASQSRGHPG